MKATDRLPERACLLIADISGYTEYLAGVELDHAQDVLADLLGVVVESLRPSFRLAKLEGDAAFFQVPADEVDGSLLLDRVEGCYFAFRRRLLSIRQSSTCECNACILIPTLDLKLVVHHGTVVRHHVAGHEELIGQDVNLVHRLLKNSVRERLGVSAYALLTDACLAATALDPVALEMRPHRDLYEHVGEISGWVHDLERAWKFERERRRVYVGPDDAIWSISADFPAHPELVWEFATSPRRRAQWLVGVTSVNQDAPTGRRGPGTTNHCMHGEAATVEEIVDWRPPRYVTGITQPPGAPSVIFTHEVVPTADGATLQSRMKLRRPEDKASVEAGLPMLEEALTDSLEILGQLLAEEMEHRTAEPEPTLPP